MPEVEEICITDPFFCFIMWGATACKRYCAPERPTASSFSHCSGGNSGYASQPDSFSFGRGGSITALLMRISIRPASFTTFATARFTSSGFVISTSTCVATLVNFSERAVSNEYTFAPAALSAFACSTPSRPSPPVITATRPSREKSCSISFFILFPNFRSNFFSIFAISCVMRELIPILAARCLNDKVPRISNITQGIKSTFQICAPLSKRDRCTLNIRVCIWQSILHVNADDAPPEFSNFIGNGESACELITHVIIYAECLGCQRLFHEFN